MLISVLPSYLHSSINIHYFKMESRPLTVRQLGVAVPEQRTKWRNEEPTEAKQLATSGTFINIPAVDRYRIIFNFWIWKPVHLGFADRHSFTIFLKHLF